MSIQVRNLSHVYNRGLTSEQVALDNINFDIYDGEIIGIIGHTGSGKSTLLQHLNGLLKADSGNIIIGGIDITGQGVAMKEIRRRVGLVFQYPEYQLFEETVAKDVAFGPRNLGLSEKDVDGRVRESLEMVGIDYDEFAERSPFELSGGQKRMVAIAGVIAMKPQVLILDEPTAGLDPGSHKEVLQLIRNVHEKQNNIIVFVSHDMADIAEMSDKVIVMDRGKLIMLGTPEEIFSKKERLDAIALNVPPVTDMMYRIKERGIDIGTDVLTLKDAEEALYAYLRGINR